MISSKISSLIQKALPPGIRETARLQLFGLLKIPVLFFVSPRVLELSDQRCEVKIPLNRRTRNHLRSMYFGVLAAGADCAAGLLAVHLIDVYGDGKVSLIFKDFHADFLKRPEAATHFICEAGDGLRQAVEAAVKTGERQNIPVAVKATVPSLSGDESVAEFTLTISLKVREKT